ncbi:MAG: C40 family peptidase [Chitinivibrionales bacterium]|nr:C40 family peptidase [Chitinivibrionales bacterium]
MQGHCVCDVHTQYSTKVKKMVPEELKQSVQYRLLRHYQGILRCCFGAVAIVFLSDGCAISNAIMRPSQRVSVNETEELDFADAFADSKSKPAPKVRNRKKQRKTTAINASAGQLKQIVESYIGTKYLYGGTTRRGMDCSGFIWRVFKQLGCDTTERSSSPLLYNSSTPIRLQDAMIGDLVFFRRGNKIFHVGIYVGDFRFAHASLDDGVRYSDLDDPYYSKYFAGIRRLYSLETSTSDNSPQGKKSQI